MYHVILGLKIDPNKLYKTTKIKAWEHSYPEEFVFHPITGDRLWCVSREPIKFLDPDNGYLAAYPLWTRGEEWGSQVFSYALKSNDEHFFGGEECFVCLRVLEEEGKLDAPSPKAVTAFIAKMKAAGVWDEDNYGTWLVEL